MRELPSLRRSRCPRTVHSSALIETNLATEIGHVPLFNACDAFNACCTGQVRRGLYAGYYSGESIHSLGKSQRWGLAFYRAESPMALLGRGERKELGLL